MAGATAVLGDLSERHEGNMAHRAASDSKAHRDLREGDD